MFEPDTTLGPLELSPRCPNFAKSFGDLSFTLRGFAVSFLMLIEVTEVTIETPNESQSSVWQGLSTVFRPQYRTRTVLGLFMLEMIQLSGIDGGLYVS